MGRGGALVEMTPFDRRVVGSNPALAATCIWTLGKSFTYSSACKLRRSVNCCGRERFGKAHAAERAIEIDKYNTIQQMHADIAPLST